MHYFSESMVPLLIQLTLALLFKVLSRLLNRFQPSITPYSSCKADHTQAAGTVALEEDYPMDHDFIVKD